MQALAEKVNEKENKEYKLNTFRMNLQNWETYFLSTKTLDIITELKY